MRVILKPGGIAIVLFSLTALTGIAITAQRRVAQLSTALHANEEEPVKLSPSNQAALAQITEGRDFGRVSLSSAPNEPFNANKVNYLIEAESRPRAVVQSDKTASHKKFVHADGEYEPLGFFPIPSKGDAFTVWAKVRGTSIQLKGIPNGNQAEYEWSYAAPKVFQWVRLGRHTSEELGKEFLLIRGDKKAGGADSGLDAVFVTADDSVTPSKTHS